MTSTTRNEARIASNLRQIATLRSRRDEMVSSSILNGTTAAKCQETCEAVSNQICELYAEIDAIEAGETTTEQIEAKADEVALVTREEVLAVAHLGWTVKDVLKVKAKKARR